MTKLITISIEGDNGIAKGPFPFEFLRAIPELSGRKIWKGSESVKFDATPGNIRILESMFNNLKWIDKGGSLKAAQDLENMPTQAGDVPAVRTRYKPKRKLLKHMDKALNLGALRQVYAYLLEMGLCKTGIIIANAGILFFEGRCTGVLVLSPKGVHEQWAEEIEKDLDAAISRNILVWRQGKVIEEKLMNRKGLSFLSMNIDAIRTTAGSATAERFLKLHNGRSMMVVDESHLIKTAGTDRTRESIKLGKLAAYRRICTGTPITRNILDAWTQFNFLDWKILGQKYAIGFKSRYCVMGGFEGRQIVGSKNTEEFYRLIAPHAFRLTKKEALDLPEKIRIPRQYIIGDETRRHYKSLRETYLTQLKDGDMVDAKNGAVAILRLQQVLCGYLPKEDGSLETISSERIDILMDIISQVNGPVIIWARFIEDIRRIIAALEKQEGEGCAVPYWGGVKALDRRENVQAWLKGAARFFVSNPAAGGIGLNLQGACTTAIYYSQSHDAMHRWQSEDRIDRQGSTGACTYFDIVARGTVDVAISRNLQNKKSISDLTLDEIRIAIEGWER